MADDLHGYEDDGDADGGTVGYEFGGKPKRVGWHRDVVGRIHFASELPLAERKSLMAYLVKKHG
jgi:hypothetical protein